MTDPDMFEPYDRLIEIEILGRTFSVPENNSILRCLQFLDMESISYGDFCWNGECLNCQVWIMNGEKEKAVMACRTNAVEGMRIVRMSDQIILSEPSAVADGLT
jgi:NADH dehydrogenase/NADH:ubiquinone oxidoreductase 75 kD subunit (chain G)